ncbi:MAG TPA: hypothetical protein VGS97_10050 [Actinocrinis sp.]|uniref:hypothetical protein n=1 Tax=Actinocrinis sp. TaxID=1920516 RepID=UPI002DDC9467|nr:hypothetical protein [Actinocrinis sp.]HEV2344422.1 hypothetical protein [Actinocrinis sp.]
MNPLSESMRMVAAFEESQRQLIEQTESSPVTRDVIAQALEAMWRGPVLPFSYFRRPGARMYRAPLREPLVCSWLDRKRQATAWQEAGRSAWIESVRAKLQSAVYATDQGWSWTWDAPGVYVRPDLPEGLQVRYLDAPPYLPEASR